MSAKQIAVEDELKAAFGVESKDESIRKRRSGRDKVGLVLLGVTGTAAVALSVIAAPFVAPALRKVCLPYVPASTLQVQNVLTALKGTTGKTLVDLGSGDGRLVVAASKHLSVRATGVELNPWLVLYSRYSAWRAGLSPVTRFCTTDLWKLDLTQYDNVVIFGVEEMMEPLEHKLSRELPSGGQVVACRFPLPSWSPCKTIGSGIDTVWLYDRQQLKGPSQRTEQQTVR